MIFLAWFSLIFYILSVIGSIKEEKDTVALLIAFPIMGSVIACLVYLILLL